MTVLVNETLVTETGITVCKPNVYSLDVLMDDAGNRSLCLLNMGRELVRFDITDDVREQLIGLLSYPERSA